MPRPRKPEDHWLPPKVYRHPRGFVYKPEQGRMVKLAPLDATEALVWAEYRKVAVDEKKRDTFGALIKEFMHSADFQDLSTTTQKDYQKYSLKVDKVFGKMRVGAIEPKHVRQYMDIRGKASRTQANREKAFMSRVFRWAFERGKAASNPCKGVRQFTEKQRDRYVTDKEYDAVYEHATDPVRVAMEISYLCAARQGDVLNLTFADVLDEGLFIKQGKTGVKQIKAWTPRLREAVALARTIGGTVRTTKIIAQPKGTSYSPDGFRSAWRNSVLRAREATGLDLDFSFHDLKAKGISDFDGGSRDKQQFSGHKTERQVATYDRRIKVVPTISKGRS